MCLVSKRLVTFPALYPALYRSQDHSNSPAGCHQHMQYVNQHKTEGQRSTSFCKEGGARRLTHVARARVPVHRESVPGHNSSPRCALPVTHHHCKLLISVRKMEKELQMKFLYHPVTIPSHFEQEPTAKSI